MAAGKKLKMGTCACQVEGCGKTYHGNQNALFHGCPGPHYDRARRDSLGEALKKQKRDARLKDLKKHAAQAHQSYEKHKEARKTAANQNYHANQPARQAQQAEHRHLPSSRQKAAANHAKKKQIPIANQSALQQLIDSPKKRSTVRKVVRKFDHKKKARGYFDTEIQTRNTTTEKIVDQNGPANLGEATVIYETEESFETVSIQAASFALNRSGKGPTKRLLTTPQEQAEMVQFLERELQGLAVVIYTSGDCDKIRVEKSIGAQQVKQLDITYLDAYKDLVSKIYTNDINDEHKIYLESHQLQNVIDNLVVTPSDGEEESDLIERLVDWDEFERKSPTSLEPKLKSQADAAMTLQVVRFFEYVADEEDLEPDGPISLA